ncbi:hypothetical protein NDU88_011123 [Pleurodeles waltl]|uniref:Uncharacterized protein n=1 Tax=Pleurodeles waltl TaxID=8319 RepID=A0AAV7R0P6_PLEWA|nr:hypothetical protein NDU88_011123 [Pleurodeles waltl]
MVLVLGAWPQSRAWRTLNGSAPEGPTLNRCLDALRLAVLCPERSGTTAVDGGTAEVRSCPPGADPRVTGAVRGCEEAAARRAGPRRAVPGGFPCWCIAGERPTRPERLECGCGPGGGLRRTRAPRCGPGPTWFAAGLRPRPRIERCAAPGAGLECGPTLGGGGGCRLERLLGALAGGGSGFCSGGGA